MTRSLLQRFALVVGVAVGVLGTPAAARAQKALVYCPVSIDATGCNAIVTALTGPAYPLGVDRGYDGTNGTVDLKTVDLFGYSVFVVPSLADDATSQPYAKLRDPEVVEHLKAALIGRIALWSGTPDQGATNRPAKDALIQNLAAWAAGAFATAKGPGLVGLLDASSSAVARYDWLRAITPLPVTADANLLGYDSVRTLNQRGATILTSGSGQIKYANMATYGFVVPNGAPRIMLDAVGQTGTALGGQVVLVTMEAGNASSAVVRTDKGDYAPGQTVTITGSGWQAGETVKLTLHMDPLRASDTELSATADGSGNFTNTEFAPGDYDVGVRFVLTAVGQTSGARAQTTFTDGSVDGATVNIRAANCTSAPGPITVGTIVCATGTISVGGNGTGGDYRKQWVPPTGVTPSPARDILVTNASNGDSYQDTFAPTSAGTWTFLICKTSNAGPCSSGNTIQPTTFVVSGTVATNTVVTSSANPSTYGNSVTFTATVTGSTNPQCGAVEFKDGATSLGSVTLSSSNVVTLATSSLSAGTHPITAVYTPAASGCSFGTSTSAPALSQTVNKRAVTVTAEAKTKEFGAADPALTFQITAGSLVGTDNFTGSLSRDAGESVGSFAIKQGTLALNANYTLTYIGANLTITARALTITADPQTKAYGAADPPLTYKLTSGTLASGDALTGSLTRVAGESVTGSPYAILQGTVTAGSNYSITYVGANLTITPRSLTVTADSKSKVYGEVDPPLTYTLTTGTLASGDAFSGALTRAPGESVGGSPYAIQIGTLSAGPNYAITFVGANFSITTRPITVTADPQSKAYGDADPPLTYKVTAGSLAFTDAFTGALQRDPGQAVATYAIKQGTLALSANYTLTFVGANLTISARPITVTADAQSKTYGDPDPPLTYKVTAGSLAFTDAFTGSLTRAAGENVGVHAITQGTLALNSNYTLTFVGANLTINLRPITVTADAQTKVYGDPDPALTYKLTSGTLVNGDGLSGALSRAGGETVSASPYAIQQGTLTAGSNYSLTFVSANLTITPRPITVTADAQTKTYGDPDPALTYKITTGTLAPNDALAGLLARISGENVGSYAIKQGTLSGGANYNITFVEANLTITARPVTVAADAQTKVYGFADPPLTYKITSGSLVSTDAFAGALTRAAGENVGTYAIQQGTLALSANYVLTYVGASLVIGPRPITITAQPKSKVYGDADPTLTYDITSGTLVGEDTFSGSLSRTAGEDVGTYPITQGTVALSSNYTLTFIGANLTITPRPVTVTADPQTKVYGDADPTFTYKITAGNLVFGNTLSGNLARAAGQSVGTYAIQQGTLTGGANYNLTYVGADLTITARPITVTADAQTKVYGNADPTLTYKIVSGSLAFSDAFAGALTRAAGENVGTYAITQGTLSLGTNYDLTFNGASLTITQRPVTVTADAKSKVYGAADPPLTYQITNGSLAFSDAFAGALVRDPGNNAGTYAIKQGTLALSTNYALTYVGANLTITKAPLTVAFNNVSMNFGGVVPSFTVAYSGFVLGDTPTSLGGTLIFSPAASTFSGTSFAGVYTITPGGLTSPNYYITFTAGTFTIVDTTAPVVTNVAATPNPVALNGSLTITATVSDANTGNSNIKSAEYSLDGGNTWAGSMSGAPGGPTVTATKTLSLGVGVYNVCVRGTDVANNTSLITDQNSVNTCVLVAVFDPSAGFVTGGGWITSPPQAYAADRSLTGKATFGFVSKYKKGQSTPDGETEFQFHAAGFNFKSTSYEWLVIAGAKAQYKGSGTINGSGDYFFMLTAVDGDLKAKGSPDLFRIKVWNKTTLAVIYDNALGVPDTSDPVTSLGGGSIQIHEK
jgi:hypothetical protein